MQKFEVFTCYSHKDEKLRDELDRHLSSLKRQGLIVSWYDRKIGPGKEWEGQIDKHINSAHIILLLISSDFLASDYCYDIEMKHALEKHEAREARVIPIMLRPVDWKGCPFEKLQVLPTDAEPVTTWGNKDKAFLDIANGLRSVCEELRRQADEKASPKSILSHTTEIPEDYLSDEMSVILTDDFETDFNWKPYLEGEVSQSADFTHSGKYSLKKDKRNDPHGGYKTFDQKISRGFIFWGWLYRPSEEMRGVAERLAVEDSRGCGYGFSVSHKINGIVIYGIELRENGICTDNIGDAFALRHDPLKDVWYYFYLQLADNGILHFSIDVSGYRLLGISAKDTKYREFSRVVVHGGHPYYLDDIKIIGYRGTT